MKITPKDKNTLLLFLSFLLVVGAAILLFFPNLIDYPYSVSKIIEKKGCG